MLTPETTASASLSAIVIRKDGTVEDLGEIWNNQQKPKNTNLEEEKEDGTSR